MSTSSTGPTPGRSSAGAGGSATAAPAAAKRPRSRLRRVLRNVALALVALAVVGAVALFVLYRTVDIPAANAEFTTETTTVYYSDGKHEIGTLAEQNRQSVPLADVPEHVQNAVIAAEDRSFYDNQGIDLAGIARAAFNNARGGDTQGASTITQQYVKVLYLNQDQSYIRKLREAVLAVKIQQQKSKEEVLEGYLNTVYFGRGAYGIQAAALAFFDREAKDLTVAQGAVLASVLNSPGNLDPANGKAARTELTERYEYVLDGMVEMGTLDADVAARAQSALPAFPDVKEQERYGGPKGHLLKLVEAEMLDAGFEEAEVTGGGLSIVTTFDYKAQKAAVKAVKAERPRANADGVHIGIAAVEPGTGALRAMYGGPNYLENSVNYALAGQQPGSSFKPFALAAGLESGFALSDSVTGNTYVYPDGSSVSNEFGTSYGPAISLLYATAVSSNTGYVDLVGQMGNGPEKVIDTAVAAGIPRNSPGLEPVAGIPLGTADIRPLDMAVGYATFAAEGEQADWYVIEKVDNSDGKLVYEHKGTAERAFGADVAADVSYALQEVVTSGTGTEALALGCPVAGKTGTAALRPDTVTSAWFVGYTPRLAAAVMYIRGDGRRDLDGVGGLSTFFGGEYPARTFTAFMDKAGQDQDCVDFPEPAFLDGNAGTPSVAPTTQAPTTTPPPTTTKTSPPPETTTPPTEEPTDRPTKQPTEEPTESPRPTPTDTPTEEPPETSPTSEPTQTPRPTTPPESPGNGNPGGNGNGGGESNGNAGGDGNSGASNGNGNSNGNGSGNGSGGQ